MSDVTGSATRICVLHLNQVGDLVFSLPALAALRSGFPGARLVSVLREGLAPLLEGGDLVDEVVGHRGSRDFFATAERLRGLEVDLAICLSESPRTRLLAYLSRSAERAGLDGGPLSSLLTRGVEKIGLPSVANNLRLVRELGCPTPHETYVGLLAASDEDRRAAADLLARAGLDPKRGRLVVLAPGVSARRSLKEWSPERFAALVREVASWPGCTAVVVGTDGSPTLGELPREGALDLTGRTSLRQLLGVLASSEVFVGNDSGALHLAAALGVRCVALFGPTDPDQTGPQGRGHVVLRAEAGGPGSMEKIDVAEVVAAVGRLVAARDASPLGDTEGH